MPDIAFTIRYDLRDAAFMCIARILSHYNKPDSRYNISTDMGVILEYISHLELQIERRTEHENSRHLHRKGTVHNH